MKEEIVKQLAHIEVELINLKDMEDKIRKEIIEKTTKRLNLLVKLEEIKDVPF